MTLYFDSKVQFIDDDAVSTIVKWHPMEPIFAVASYSSDRGGSVTIFDDTGEPLRDISYPVQSISQATSLCWHPDKRILSTGWENGEIYIWFNEHREFASVLGPHKAPIILMEFSEKGSRMVTADSMGLLTGWRCNGQYQFLTMFSHDLKDTLLHITFRRMVENQAKIELSNLTKAAVAGDESALDTLTSWRPKTASRNMVHSIVHDNHCFYVGTQSGCVFYLNQSGSCIEVYKSNNSSITQILWHPKRDAIVCLMEDMTVIHFLAEASGALTELDRVKLSGKIPGNNGIITWAGSVLAIITGDFSVRIWDIENSDNYLLKTEMINVGEPTTTSVTGTSASDLTSGIGSGAVVPITPMISTLSSTSSEIGFNTNGNNNINSSSISTTIKYSSGSSEVFTCMAYCSDNQTLCVGTNQGNLYTWKKATGTSNSTANYAVDGPENAWQLTNISMVRGAIKQCCWGINEVGKPCILLNCVSHVYLLKEQPLCSRYIRNMSAVQKSANQIFIEHTNPQASAILNCDIAITNIALSGKYIILTNGRKISAYKVTLNNSSSSSTTSVEHHPAPASTSASKSSTTASRMYGGSTRSAEKTTLNIEFMQTFNCECLDLYIHDESIFCLTSHDVKLYSMGGVVLKEITTSENEGKIIGCDVTSSFLTIFTMNGYLKVYDITRHDHKQLFHPRSGYDLFENFGEIIAAKCNGHFMAVLLANESLIPDGRVYCWNYQNDTVNYFDFLKCNDAAAGSGRDGGGGGGTVADGGPTNDKSLFVAKLPVGIHWDTDDHRLLAVQTKVIHVQPSNKKDNKRVVADSQVVIMFESDKGALNILEAKDLNFGEELINLCIPHLVTLNINSISRITMRDFQGMENCDAETRSKIIDFSLHISEGNMDLAYRCIRTIQSKVVWTNLAKMCVETGRLDVAKVCLGHLQNAKSVRALRQAMEDPYLEENAKVATLAVELGMLEKAEELYKSCGRYDLINKLFQAQGEYDKAIKLSEEFDRVNLKHSYFQKAEDLKEKGDMKTALKFYEKTQNPVQNITQLLLDDPLMLKDYMEQTTDPKMLKWWGQYIESTGDMDGALTVYQKADDWFSQVKILCYLGEIGKADVMARNSGNRAACYHLARHYENIGKYQEAVQFYMRAQTFSNAVRICKEMDLQDELWQVASSSNNKKDKSIAAAYFEDCGMYKKAVELYHKSGMLHKAIDIAFNSEQPETLEVIADELTPDSDKELIERCTEFFMKMGQQQRAVQLLARTKQYEEAAQICLHNNVPITETLADLLTPSKEELTDERRTHILMKIAEVLQEQGDYHMATKKFTQAGDKIRAMKSLLKSGDTEKIIFFANMSRQREVYIMAANYLQAHNWQKYPKILKHIVTFYSKGQAYDSLANFYATCAQVEIDDYNDYEKALKAMHEAAKSLSKVPHSQRAADNLQRSIIEVTHVLKIQELLHNEDYNAAIQECRSMLNRPEVAPIRRSDVLAYLVKALGTSHQYIESVGILRELALKEPHWNRRGILDKGLVEVIARESGIDFEKIWDTSIEEANDGGDYDEIEENIRQ